MHFVHDDETFNLLDRIIISMKHSANAASDNPDCFDTTQPTALRFEADIIELHGRLCDIRQRYTGSNRWTYLDDATIVEIVRNGEV